MISLRELLEITDDERSIWQTYGRRWGARNTTGAIRYFRDRELAVKFARGEIKAPHPGRPIRKKRAEPKEKIQTYDMEP